LEWLIDQALVVLPTNVVTQRDKTRQELLQFMRQRFAAVLGERGFAFDEVEAGHWYARAMSSYALLQAFSGARFDAVDKVLYLKPVVKGDFRCFLSTATGFGTVGVKNGQPFIEIVAGDVPYVRIEYIAAEGGAEA